MIAPFKKSPAEIQSQSDGTNGASIDNGINSEDSLSDFFDFFDYTVDQIHAYILHRTHMPDVSMEITMNVYFLLLRRRRFFWWRNVTDISILMPVVEKVIAHMPKWRGEILSESYIEELRQCVPNDNVETNLQKLEEVVQAIKGLPVKEQRIAIMCFFLHWKPAYVAEILGKNVSAIEKTYEAILNQLIDILGEKDVFHKINVHKFLEQISCPSLESDFKSDICTSIMEKDRAGQMSNIRLLAPVVAALLIVSSAFVGSAFIIEPQSLDESITQIAAAQVIILSEPMESLKTLRIVEENIQSITAYAVEKQISAMSVELASFALKEQLRQRKEVNKILEDMDARLLLSAKQSIAHAENLH